LQSFQYTPYAGLLAFAALVSALLAIYIWNRREIPAANPAVALMLAMFIWSAGYMFEFMGVELETKVFWAKIQYFGIVSLPAALFLFAMAFSGRESWLTIKKLAALAAIPLLVLILVLSNESHRLVWTEWSLGAVLGDILALRVEHGPAFWLLALYGHSLVAASTVLILQALKRRPPEYRGQLVSTLLGIFIPWVVNLISNLVSHIDLTPFAFIVSGFSFVWSIYKYHLFENAPNAFETVIASMNDAVFILDMRNRIINVNPAGQQMLSLTSAEILGRPSREVFKNQTNFLDGYQNAVNIREEITIGEETKERYYELSISPLTDRFDKILGRAIILHDISDRKQAENAMAIARDKALESSRVKSEFLARVSHELRTPLGVIRGYADLLSEPVYGTLSELQTKAVSEIIDSTQRISDMVGELLDEARLAAGAVQLDIKPFKPAEILEDVREKLSVLANQKKLALSTEIDPQLPAQLVGDPTRIHQMVTNLTSNSIKFTRQGEVKIRFYPCASDMWAFEVTDTGPGIPKEAHESIFEPFRQADSSIPRIFGGTGLGLSIVKHLTNLMNGKITVQSEVGQGSKFTVILPIHTKVSE
jgi:PAS domain S-box-containing protein